MAEDEANTNTIKPKENYPGTGSEQPGPIVQVFLLGPFRLRWSNPDEEREADWKSRAAARFLLKLLLCAPNRQLSRSQIVGVLWPEVEEEKARESLRTAVKVLRQVLHTNKHARLVQSQRDTLKLSGQQDLWVDGDAFEDLVQQASHTPASPAALPLWEQAKDLLQGEFLVEDQSNEWATCRWVKLRRQKLLATRRLMVHSLADLYMQQGQHREAEKMLHEHVIHFPSDQDALSRLMQLLIARECFDEALSYYERGKIALAGMGKQPAKHLLALVEQAQKTMETVREVQIPIEHATISSVTTMPAEQGSSIMHISRRDLLQETSLIVGAALGLPLEMVLDPSLPERLSKALKKPSSLDPITLNQLGIITQNKRHQFVSLTSSGQSEIFDEVSGHLTILIRLLEQSQPESIYTSLCATASETALLLGDIHFNGGWNEQADAFYTVALEAANVAHDTVLQSVILGRKSFVPIYGLEPQKALPLLEEALEYAAQKTADIIPAWLWAVKAEAYAQIDDSNGCINALEQSAYFLDRGQPGPISYSFADGVSHAVFSRSKLLGYKGACFVRLSWSEPAQELLHQELATNTYMHHQSISLVDLGLTYIQQANIKQACVCAGQALAFIKQTGSLRVFQRILKLRRALVPWEHTRLIKSLDQQIAPFLGTR